MALDFIIKNQKDQNSWVLIKQNYRLICFSVVLEVDCLRFMVIDSFVVIAAMVVIAVEVGIKVVVEQRFVSFIEVYNKVEFVESNTLVVERLVIERWAVE